MKNQKYRLGFGFRLALAAPFLTRMGGFYQSPRPVLPRPHTDSRRPRAPHAHGVPHARARAYPLAVVDAPHSPRRADPPSARPRPARDRLTQNAEPDPVRDRDARVALRAAPRLRAPTPRRFRSRPLRR
eukprot:30621-Pelagococcus_subviridis.AAC.1